MAAIDAGDDIPLLSEPRDWPRVWAGAGIAVAHPRDGWFRQAQAGGATLQPANPSFGGEAVPGDLAVLHDGEPDGTNQQVRRVLAVEPSPVGGVPSLRLGPPLPRAAWPYPLLSNMRPQALPLRRSGDATVLLGEDGAPVVTVDMRREGAEAFVRTLREVVSVASSAGVRDATFGEARSYDVERGHGPAGDRTWLVVDDVGAPLASIPRGLLDRSPPGPALALRKAAEASYEASRGDVAARLARGPGIAAHDAVEPGGEYLPSGP